MKKNKWIKAFRAGCVALQELNDQTRTSAYYQTLPPYRSISDLITDRSKRGYTRLFFFFNREYTYRTGNVITLLQGTFAGEKKMETWLIPVTVFLHMLDLDFDEANKPIDIAFQDLMLSLKLDPSVVCADQAVLDYHNVALVLCNDRQEGAPTVRIASGESLPARILWLCGISHTLRGSNHAYTERL